MNRQDLYEYLRTVDFSSKKRCDMAAVYFLVTHDGVTEPAYFTPYEDAFFESPCLLYGHTETETELEDSVKEMYLPQFWEEALAYERMLYRSGVHYQIENFQTEPYLETIDRIEMISETECLDWLLAHAEKRKSSVDMDGSGQSRDSDIS